MLIVDTTKKITIWYNINFASLLRRKEYNNLHARAEFQPNTSRGYNPVLFQHLTQEEIQLYTIQVLMTLKRYRFTGKIVDTPPLLFFNTRDTLTTNILCKNESPK